VRIIVYPDVEQLATGAADLIAEAIGLVPRMTLGLAGGNTPRRTYEMLRARRLPWDQIDAWLADERWVPFEHPECNGAMAEEALFRHVPARLHRIRWSPNAAPDQAALAYERVLHRILPREGPRYRPDLVLLGLGDDGHTASLFPGTAALDEEQRLYVANWVPRLDAWRLTATLPLLQAARTLVFLVAGQTKATAVRSVLSEGADLPVQRVTGGDGEAFWLLDEPAASELRDDLFERPE